MLSRLSITGNITENVPLCIISEIADAHGINYNIENLSDEKYFRSVIETINNEKNINYVTFPINNTEEWGFLARFINKSTSWPQNLLLKAYEYLSSFMIGDVMCRIPSDFIAGIQNPDNIYLINPCILYKACKESNINLTKNTTVDQMSSAIFFQRCNPSYVLDKAINLLIKSTQADLVNFIIYNKHKINIKENVQNYDIVPSLSTSYSDLQKIEDKITDVFGLQLLVKPTTFDGAIALAAVKHRIDISRASNPIDEYYELVHKGLAYKPIDNWFKYWFKINRSFFDLTEIFNPLFPRKLYNKDTLFKMAKYEGCENGDPYECLQMAYISETFYLGIFPLTSKNATTIDLDELSDVPYGQLLSYGQIDVSLKTITISELTDLFTANQNFTSPFGPDKVFSKQSIIKLKNILHSPHGPDHYVMISSDTLNIRRKLLDLIILIELENEPDHLHIFLNMYKYGDQKTKTDINDLLKIILEMGMYMRGWDGESNYPVQEAPVPYDKEPTVAVNVTTSISEYKIKRDKMGKLGSTIHNLPLVRYRDGDYQLSKSVDDGFTIGERIMIAEKGYNNPTIYSCIRMSSNWICSSIHKYTVLLGLEEPFDIFKLRYIA